MKPIRLHRGAKSELREAVLYYENEREGFGEKLQRRVEEACEKIQRDPALWPRVRPSSCRKCFVEQFPYVVIYRERRDDIFVVAIAHGSRRPGYWRGREAR